MKVLRNKFRTEVVSLLRWNKKNLQSKDYEDMTKIYMHNTHSNCWDSLDL